MDEKKLIPGQTPEHEGGAPEFAPADRLQELYDGLTPEDKVLFPSSKTLSLV